MAATVKVKEQRAVKFGRGDGWGLDDPSRITDASLQFAAQMRAARQAAPPE
jgi:hypothetical protein